jgi:hypothetical protein
LVKPGTLAFKETRDRWCGSGELNDVLRKTSGKDSATLAKIKRISKFTFSIKVPYLLLHAVTFFDRISKDERPPT